MTDSDKLPNAHGADLIQSNQSAMVRTVDLENPDYIWEPPPPYTVSSGIELNPTVVQQTIVFKPPLKHHPVIYTCEICSETVLTRVEHVNTQNTHMCAGFICGCTLWCMLCCLGALPYMLSVCKITQHYCPNCENLIGQE